MRQSEIRNSAYAVVEWNSLLAVSFILAPLARRLVNFDAGQRQVVPVEQLGVRVFVHGYVTAKTMLCPQADTYVGRPIRYGFRIA